MTQGRSDEVEEGRRPRRGVLVVVGLGVLVALGAIVVIARTRAPADESVAALRKREMSAWVGGDPYAPENLVKTGGVLHLMKACNACHGVNGERSVGPPLNGLWGSERELSDGKTVTADDEYFRRAVLDPGAELVAGYPNQMMSYRGKISEDEMRAMIAYYRSLPPGRGTPPAIGTPRTLK